MIRVTKEIAHRVWSYLEAGDDIETICSVLPNIEERTIERLRRVMNGFKESKSNKELATAEWKETTIAQRRDWWGDYLRSKHGWSRQKHLESLLEMANRLRSRIYNPNIPMRGFNGQSAWFWSNYDWRLFPDFWFAVVCPFPEFLYSWIPNIDDLLSHLSDIKFYAHLMQLKEDCEKLRQELNQHFNKLKQDASWDSRHYKLKDTLSILLVDNLKPDQPPTEEDISYLPNKAFSKETVDTLRVSIPDLDKKYDGLERQLQQLWDDLDPYSITLIIENGKCEHCS